MKRCSCLRRRKQLAYGEQRGLYWCDGCDANKVTQVNKKKARVEGRKEINKEMRELDQWPR